MAVRVIHQSSPGESPSTCLTDPVVTDLVALADVKAHCKVDISDDDAYITALIGVAIETVERMVQRSLQPKTFEWVTADLRHSMRLPLAPVAQVRWVQYATFPFGPPNGGPMLTLDPTIYFVSPDGQATVINQMAGQLYPFVGQANEPVVVRFDAGVIAASVSASIIHAIKLIVGNLYENRVPFVVGMGSISEVPLARSTLSVIDQLLYAERWQ